MESRTARLNKNAPRRIRAQAALWVTDLHGPGRDAELEARVRRWIDADPRHAAAFELATEAWERSGDLQTALPRRALKLDSMSTRIPRWGLACAAVLIGSVMAAIYVARDGTLATGADEQKTVELSDGTQVSLNANTRLLVQYDDRIRKVTLAGGEAFFDVAKHQPRPFVVVAGDRKVIAVGTSFMVRREETANSAFAVTLVEGRIAVEALSGPDVLPSDPTNGVKLLTPGERLRFQGDASQRVDLPSLERLTAWRRGQLIFDDTTLGEAVAEFNRYGSHKITIDSARAQKLRVGGVFRIGDPSSFAQAMASAYHLRIVNRGDRIILSDPEDYSR